MRGQYARQCSEGEVKETAASKGVRAWRDTGHVEIDAAGTQGTLVGA